VLLKRGLSATLEELLMAAEYVLKEGNPNVMLCERGIRTFETAYRFTLDLTAVPVLKELTHLPVIVDPSHAAGRRDLVEPLSLAAAAAGADGIIVEVHPSPRRPSATARSSSRGDALPGYASRSRRRGPSPARAVGPAASTLPTVAVIGVGLIGGSDRAGRARAPRREVAATTPPTACWPRPRARRGRRAAARSARPCARPTGVVAAPVGMLPDAVRRGLAPRGTDCVVTDVGSTKRAIVGADRRPALRRRATRSPAPRPPGVARARRPVRRRTWYLTPTARTSGPAVRAPAPPDRRLGARRGHRRRRPRPHASPPSRTSARARQRARRAGRRGLLAAGERLPAPARPSATDRVAGANSAIWRDIYLANADALGRAHRRRHRPPGRAYALLRAATGPRDGAGTTPPRRPPRLLEAAWPAGGARAARLCPQPARRRRRVALELGAPVSNIVDMACTRPRT
jgi:hypothetical protein